MDGDDRIFIDNFANYTGGNTSDASTLSITFEGTTGEPTNNEFYAIDNVVVSTNAMPVGTASPLSARHFVETTPASIFASDFASGGV